MIARGTGLSRLGARDPAPEPGDRQDCQRISGKVRRKSMAVLSVPGSLVSPLGVCYATGATRSGPAVFSVYMAVRWSYQKNFNRTDVATTTASAIAAMS
jgi:hypothetical protein